MYRIQQFADLAGVTVRTLRHYDRLGLLRPSHRTSSGYRVYGDGDLPALERILVLRYCGLSLQEIGFLLPRLNRGTLAETFSTQARILRERLDGIARVIAAIEHAQGELQNGAAGLPLFQSLLKEITMQQNNDWAKQYYSPEAQTAIDNGPKWTPELQEEVSAKWATMFAAVEDAMARNLPKSSPEAKSLAERWMALVGEFTGGNPQVLAGLNKMYADRENWPADRQRTSPVKPELMQWIRDVQHA